MTTALLPALALDPALRAAVRRELLGEAAALRAQAKALEDQARAKERLAGTLLCDKER